MSSYNENLRSNVIASLQAQELELQKVKAKKNASMFTLYYAEAATLKASEQLESTAGVFKKKMSVKTQAVDNSNISNNLLDSAGQASLYVKQSISNASVCAANVQLAANAIVRLASDLGSIYGIVNAADAKSDMYVLADESRKLINQTAYDAGLASQLAMELSILTSEVTASTVQDKAKANNELMNSILKIVSDEFTAVSQLALTEDATLASSSAAEKQAEGDYLDVTVDYKAAKAAYEATNQGLNLDLKVSGKTSTGFTVSFQPIGMPFQHLRSKAQIASNFYFPVKNYYVIVVKDTKKSTFSISNAEELLISTIAAAATPATASNTASEKETSAFNQKRSILPITMTAPKSLSSVTDSSSTGDSQPTVSPLISQVINFQEMMIGDAGPFTIQDSDGDPIKLGVKYVVFVLALYTDDYKKKLNSFDDFLSAPSPSFTLKNTLAAVDGTAITVGPVQPANAPYDYLLKFTVDENPANSDKVSYRCIFLPPNDPFAGYMLNKESTLALDQEVELLESIADQYDPKIAEIDATVVGLNNYISMLNSKVTSLKDDQNKSEDSTVNQNIDSQIVELVLQINAQNAILLDEQQQLDSLEKERNDKINEIKDGIQSGRVGFLFNLKIAEQVLAGNYIVAIKTTQPPPDADASFPSGSKKAKNNVTVTESADNSDGSDFPPVSWDIKVTSDVTDNFGNPLSPGTTYVPVVLSYCTATEESHPMFSNNWSGYAHSPNFLYQPTQS